MALSFHPLFQPFSLLCLLLRLKDRNIILLLVYHDIFYYTITHQKRIQQDLITLSQTLS